MYHLPNLLKEHFNFEAFRPGQEEAIKALLEHKSLLCILPTGHGKSLLYQLPTLILPNITVVISPLLALMRDQIRQLNDRFGISSATLNSDQSEEENARVREDLKHNKIKILFVAPEQLDHVDRFTFLLNLSCSLIVVDEAHCISTWGHDFRPSYRQILAYVNAARERYPKLHVLGLTATANTRTERDIAEQLGHNLPVHRRSMNRPNIALSVLNTNSFEEKLATCAQLLKTLDGVGLVYCATRENTELLADYLQLEGYSAASYHAGYSAETKRTLQEAFLSDSYQVLTATNALGMGIDKPNLRFVIHFDVPGSITAYYQEVGRAGRDGLPSRGILLYNPEDIRIQKHFISSAQPKEDQFSKILQCLNVEPLKLMNIKQSTGFHPTLVTVILAELIDQGFVEKFSQSKNQLYRRTDKEGKPELQRFEQQYQTRTQELEQMLYYATQSEGCAMAFLRKQLGDRATEPCGQCTQCQKHSVRLPVSTHVLGRAQQWLSQRMVVIASNRRLQSQDGVALLDGSRRSSSFIYFMKQRAASSASEWGIDNGLRSLMLEEAKRLVAAHGVKALLPLPSRSWGARDSIADWLSSQLGISLLDTELYWEQLPKARQGELLNNDQRHANVHGHMSYRFGRPLPHGAVLLFDDYTGSGATLKEALRVLRKGCGFRGAIVPLTIAAVKWRLGRAGMI